MTSQKAAALAKHKKAEANGMLSHSTWTHLHTERVDITHDDEDVQMYLDNPAMKTKRPNRTALLAEVLVGECKLSTSWPLFVRACPLNPRPGVLESSVANDMKELKKIVRRITKTMLSVDTSSEPMYEHGLVDPEGCIIIQRYIDADASAVVAPGNYIFMGEGNDGITASRDCIKVAIPLTVNDYATTNDLASLDINPDKIELEFVSKLRNGYGIKDLADKSRSSNKIGHDSYIVQLRGSDGARPIAPPPKGVTISGTFHGEGRIVISHIHEVSDNSDEQLNLMEEALREGMPDDAVVIHPTGNHLSHHAGQCFKYGVPYIAHDYAEVGEQWTQAAAGWVVLDPDGTYEPQPYDAAEYIDAFSAGLEFGMNNFSRQHGWLSNHFHQFIGGPLHNPQQTAVLAGAFTGWIMNATLSVGIGEMRHINSSASNGTHLFHAALHAIYGADLWNEVSGHSNLGTDRKHFYAMIEKHPLDIESTLRLFEMSIECYQLDWSSGYGGEKYRESMEAGLSLLYSIKAFITLPNADTLKDVTGHANTCEHNVHNNGFFFNKFMEKTALDWGTDPNSVTINPLQFFRVYYAALDVLTRTERNIPISSMKVFNEVDGLTNSQMRKNPLGTNTNTPFLMDSMQYLSASSRHPNGKFSDYTSKLFIQCGKSGCSRCVEYVNEIKTINEQKLSQETSTVGLPIPAPEYDMTLPISKPTKSDTVTGTLKNILEVLEKHSDGGTLSLSKKMFTAMVMASKTDSNSTWNQKQMQIGAKILTHFSSEDMIIHYKTIQGMNDKTEGDE